MLWPRFSHSVEYSTLSLRNPALFWLNSYLTAPLSIYQNLTAFLPTTQKFQKSAKSAGTGVLRSAVKGPAFLNLLGLTENKDDAQIFILRVIARKLKCDK